MFLWGCVTAEPYQALCPVQKRFVFCPLDFVNLHRFGVFSLVYALLNIKICHVCTAMYSQQHRSETHFGDTSETHRGASGGVKNID